MGHDTHETAVIDRVYDRLEQFVGGVGAMVGVDTRDTREPCDESRSAIQLPAASASESAPAPARPAFVIVEVKAGGRPVWIVTNGTIQSPECPSRQFAESVLERLASAVQTVKSDDSGRGRR